MVPRFQTGLDAAALPTQGDPTPTGRPPGNCWLALEPTPASAD
jgi:hypothetical protein